MRIDQQFITKEEDATRAQAEKEYVQFLVEHGLIPALRTNHFILVVVGGDSVIIREHKHGEVHHFEVPPYLDVTEFRRYPVTPIFCSYEMTSVKSDQPVDSIPYRGPVYEYSQTHVFSSPAFDGHFTTTLCARR